ncbi:PGN_0703 family putative restriction endonuclease [Armatimonas sp.]|uniref:PGN_0703 family putative restriction endonuclease n=1 Tax=Armatimonas sp. TaxID=1872638 RepID=UPI00375105A8
MSYQDDLKLHLSYYKKLVLRVSAPGFFRSKPYSHILAKADADLNLLPLALPLEKAVGLSRHVYFHHLNSSQAFAFNLFLPFFSAGGAEAEVLLAALGQTAKLKTSKLEAVPCKEEGTNLDALWITDDEVTTLCEIKLSEADFGKAKDDAKHRDKLTHIYLPTLTGYVDSTLLKAPEFFGAYQILRNVWHLCRLHQDEKKGRLVFLLPRANKPLWSELTGLLAKVDPAIRACIFPIAMEDVIDSLITNPNCPPDLLAHAKELKVKYVI